MASGTKVKKHECSCGRSFRHAISLKRHQNVTGCGMASTPEPETKAKAEKSKAPLAAKSSPAPVVPVAEEMVEDDRTIVITPELVASWQAQTGFQRRPGGFVDSLEAKPAPAKKIDWVALARTGKEFVEFCGEVKTGTLRSAQTALVVLGRSAFFCSVLFLAGWFLVSKVSASDSTRIDDIGHSKLAAQTVVENFLQNAQLNQYERAQRLLAPSARDSVSADQLQMMFNSLPLHESPEEWSTELADDLKSARVIVSRSGMNEIYTLVQSEAGWGLTSVSIANS